MVYCRNKIVDIGSFKRIVAYRRPIALFGGSSIVRIFDQCSAIGNGNASQKPVIQFDVESDEKVVDRSSFEIGGDMVDNIRNILAGKKLWSSLCCFSKEEIVSSKWWEVDSWEERIVIGFKVGREKSDWSMEMSFISWSWEFPRVAVVRSQGYPEAQSVCHLLMHQRCHQWSVVPEGFVLGQDLGVRISAVRLRGTKPKECGGNDGPTFLVYHRRRLMKAGRWNVTRSTTFPITTMICLGSSGPVETIVAIFVAIPSVDCHGAPDGMAYLLEWTHYIMWDKVLNDFAF